MPGTTVWVSVNWASTDTGSVRACGTSSTTVAAITTQYAGTIRRNRCHQNTTGAGAAADRRLARANRW